MAKRKKPRGRKHKLSWYIFWLVIFVFLIGSLLTLLGSLPLWRIQNVEVKGNVSIPFEEILKVANIPMDESIFAVNFSPAQKKLSAIRAVKKARISRFLPYTVVIHITERKGAALLVVEGKSYLIDEDGVILNPAEGSGVSPEMCDLQNMPAITGVSRQWIADGILNADICRVIFGLLEQLRKLLHTRRMQIDLTDKDNMVLLLDDVLQVRMGETQDIPEKIKTVQKLLKGLGGKRGPIEYIDVQCPKFPAVKYR